MDKVVVSLDGSEASRAAVGWCADHLEPGTLVIAVCGIGSLGEFVLGVPPFDLPDSEARIVETFRQEWCEPLRRANLRCEARVVHRRQVAALLEVALVEHPDAVVVGKSVRTTFSELVGPLNRLTHRLPCTVVMVPAGTGHDQGHRVRSTWTVSADRKARTTASR